MPNNERSLTNAVDNSIQYAKQTKEYTKKIDKAYESTKKSVNGGINDISNWFSKTGKKIENTVDNKINQANNTYRDVSNTVKSSIDTGRKNTKEIVKNTMQYTSEKVVALEQFKQKLVLDSAKGLVKGIKFNVALGTMVVDYGTKRVNVFVGDAKQEIAYLTNEVKKGTITAINYAQNAPEVAINIGKKTIKKSLSVAVAGGILLCKGGGFIVNQNIKLAGAVKDKVVDTGKYLAKETVKKTKLVIDKGNKVINTGVQIAESAKNVIDSSINTAGEYVDAQVTDIVNDGRTIASEITRDASGQLANISQQLDPQKDNNTAIASN